ncbi:hypothetical protein SAMN04489751_3846 [Brevibacterium sandarakinum]|uniref:Uncharacterized protein n=1 Tax=Brevibacterium sandarakinum TaxID=629680 RepID=A0A1H1XU55_BRESA|nr:hypothetical protein SAMN04489751_3846 [Brevibacterium sandarakinum]
MPASGVIERNAGRPRMRTGDTAFCASAFWVCPSRWGATAAMSTSIRSSRGADGR